MPSRESLIPGCPRLTAIPEPAGRSGIPWMASRRHPPSFERDRRVPAIRRRRSDMGSVSRTNVIAAVVAALGLLLLAGLVMPATADGATEARCSVPRRRRWVHRNAWGPLRRQAAVANPHGRCDPPTGTAEVRHAGAVLLPGAGSARVLRRVRRAELRHGSPTRRPGHPPGLRSQVMSARRRSKR